MSVDRQSLLEEFKLLSDEDLLALSRSGELTELAQDVARSELQRRGVDLAKPTVDPPPASATEQPAETSAGAIEGDLKIESDLSRWFPVWGAPGL